MTKKSIMTNSPPGYDEKSSIYDENDPQLWRKMTAFMTKMTAFLTSYDDFVDGIQTKKGA